MNLKDYDDLFIVGSVDYFIICDPDSNMDFVSQVRHNKKKALFIVGKSKSGNLFHQRITKWTKDEDGRLAFVSNFLAARKLLMI